MKNIIKIISISIPISFIFWACAEDSSLPAPDGRLLGLEVDITHTDPQTGESVSGEFEDFYRKDDQVDLTIKSNKEIGTIEVVNSVTAEVLSTDEVNASNKTYSFPVDGLGIPFGQSTKLTFHLYFKDKGVDGFEYPSIQSYSFTVYDQIPSVVNFVNSSGETVELRALDHNIDSYFEDAQKGVSVKFKGGESSFLEIEDSPWLKFGAEKDFSISFWLKSDHDISDPALMGTMDWASSGNKGWLLAWLNGRLRVVAGNGDGTKVDFRTEESQSILSSGWHFITVTFDRDESAKLYIDGLETLSSPMTPVDIDNGQTVKINQDGTGNYGDKLESVFSQIRFYDHALTAVEIKKLSGM